MPHTFERYPVTITVLTYIRFKLTGIAMARINGMYDQSRRQRIADTLNAADTGGRPFVFAGQQFLMKTVIRQSHADRNQ